jgi:hypothetical protein
MWFNRKEDQEICKVTSEFFLKKLRFFDKFCQTQVNHHFHSGRL